MEQENIIEKFLDRKLLTSTSTRKNYTTNINTYFKLIEKDINSYFPFENVTKDEKGKKLKKPIKVFLTPHEVYEDDLGKVYWIFEEKGKPQLSRYTFFMAIKQLMISQDKSLKDLEFWDTLKAKTKGAEPESDEQIINKEDIRVILSHGNTLSRALFSIMASSGRRLDEIIALTPNDVKTEYSPTRLKITKGYDPSKPDKIKPTKSKQRTLCFISDEATKFYLEWLKERDAYLKNSSKRAAYRKKDENDNRVFPMSKSNVLIIWENLLCKSGFAEKDIKMVKTSSGKIHKRERIKQKYKDSKTNRTLLHRHGLRKFFISYLGDVALADFLAGHSTVMSRAYHKVKPEDLAEKYKELMINVTFFTTESQDVKEINIRLQEKDREIQELKEFKKIMELKMQGLENKLEIEKIKNGKQRK